MRVGDIAAGRAGDKGDMLDLSLVARDQAAYDMLCKVLTPERLQPLMNRVVGARPGAALRDTWFASPQVRPAPGLARRRLCLLAPRPALAEGGDLAFAGSVHRRRWSASARSVRWSGAVHMMHGSALSHWHRSEAAAIRLESLYGDRVEACFAERPRSLHQMLEQAAQREPERCALVCGGQRLSYRGLLDAAASLAAGMVAAGVTTGGRRRDDGRQGGAAAGQPD